MKRGCRKLPKSPPYWKTKENPCILVIFLVFLIAAGFLKPLPAAASETAQFILAWDANAEPDLDGYEIYFRNEFPGSPYIFLRNVYVDELEDPDNPMVTITDLHNDLLADSITPIVRMTEMTNGSTYYFALAAFDIQGKTSDFSEELCVQVIGTSVVDCRFIDSDDDSGSGDTISDNGDADSVSDETDSGNDDLVDDSGGSDDGGGGCFIGASSIGFREMD